VSFGLGEEQMEQMAQIILQMGTRAGRRRNVLFERASVFAGVQLVGHQDGLPLREMMGHAPIFEGKFGQLKFCCKVYPNLTNYNVKCFQNKNSK
jgi:hypothetical protein